MKSKARAGRSYSPPASPPRNGHGGERGHAAPVATKEPSVRGPKIWIYGFHPVVAAVANPGRKILRILVTAESEAAFGGRIELVSQGLAGDRPRPEIVSRETIDRSLPRGAVHQGVAALVIGLEDVTIDDICRAMDGQDGARVVVLDQVTDPHNVGAILRSAAAFGAAAVVVHERNSPGTTGVLAKAASGALESVPLVRVVNLARALDSLKKAGFWCVGLDGDAATPIHEADLSGKIAVVLGAEGEGLRRLTREHCDLMVRIPLAKGMDSLNVSNATAVALYELARRS